MTGELSQLGRVASVPDSPDQAVLERVAAPAAAGPGYLVRFTAPEFTSLCPITGQPDFAHIVIDYVPGAWIVESKSLKLYLASFRNHGAFHEACTMRIAGALVAATSEAMRTLVELMKSSMPANTRLGAARTVIESAMKLREFTELEERLAALEQVQAEASRS